MIDLDKRKLKLLKYTTLILTIVMLIFSIFNFYRKEILISVIELIFFFIGSILFYFILKKRESDKIILIILSLGYTFTIYISSNKKFNYTLFIWSLVIIGLTFYFINIKYAKQIVIIYIIIILSLLSKIFISTSLIPIPAFLNMFAFIISFTIFIYYYEITREESENKLKLEIKTRKEIEEKNKKLIVELQNSVEEIKQLSSFLPICSSCKKVRDDDGYWQQIEHYITEHSDTQFSHSLCPICAKKLYPEFMDDIKEDSTNLNKN